MLALNMVMPYPKSVIYPVTNGKRDRETVRELLQMRSCTKLKDTSEAGSKNRVALTKMLHHEKENTDVH